MKRALKNALRVLLGPLRAPLARILLGDFVDVHYSQEGEDVILSKLLGDRSEGFFVDVGAHHPMRFSNTYALYRLGWSGLVIEPNPASERDFRRYRPRDQFICAAVTDSERNVVLHEFSEAAYNTVDATKAALHVERGLPETGRRNVQALRLDGLLDQHPPPAGGIDVLSIDVEGHELPVLRSNDWGRYRPRYVVVEILDTPAEGVASSPVGSFLSALDYHHVASTVNSHVFVAGSGPPDAGKR